MLSNKIIAGNWKMNGDLSHALKFADGLKSRLKGKRTDGLVFQLYPSAPFIIPLKDALKGAGVEVGCQNVYFEKEGAFTGEIAVSQLMAIGVRSCLVGHSERRHIFGEADEVTAKKVDALLAADITPILCIGEKLDERESGKTFQVLERQLNTGLASVNLAKKKIVVAYEPVWAIGTGKTALPPQIIEAHTWIRNYVQRKGNVEVPLLYGGSVKPANAREILSCDNVDGVLVGGASLKLDDYLAISGVA